MATITQGASAHVLGLLSPSYAFDRLSVKGSIATLVLGICLQCASIWAVAVARPAFLAQAAERQVEATEGVLERVAVNAELRRRAARFSAARARRVSVDHVLLWTMVFLLVAIASARGRLGVAMLGICVAVFGVVLSALTPVSSASVWRDGLIGIAFGCVLIGALLRRGPLAGVALRIAAVGSVALTVGFVLRQLMSVALQRDPGHFTLALFVSSDNWIPWLIRLDLFGLWWAVAVGAAVATYARWRPTVTIAGCVIAAAAIMLSGLHR